MIHPSKFISILISFLFIASSYAYDDSDFYQEKNKTRKLVLKGYLNVDVIDGNNKGLTDKLNNERLLASGIGFKMTADMFINDFIALHTATAFQYYKINKNTLSDIVEQTPGSNITIPSTATIGALYQVPLDVAFQYHIAPYGGISPYFGLGYRYGLMFSSSTCISASAASGPILQVGFDAILTNDIIYSLNIENSWLQDSTISYSQDVVGTIPNSQINLSSFNVGIGVGFKL
jgi:outer membrane protein